MAGFFIHSSNALKKVTYYRVFVRLKITWKLIC